ncbi:DNA-binding response regulator, OmpR family, contains REC and winged-helix (wHTH) domain [Cetobacterium ceti]|uniref:DNA-binding response regulator, OmpR family, contains REC and winged-helix (WHTH) domain n=1 Tax=Cetobacterium ceti TaxID=180163 RepID=A0A1T4MEP2_9FUSO|nr:response regulator transcription factor [Cetobacterium ceti]SJZ65224.1 DNA-binding response regulator, OmpR family, contains REC and winged-helix (wHTH) domain [Cetobacterium ceti]
MVLIVDDTLIIVELVKDILKRENIEVDEAFNGMEALDKIKLKNFDLIIVDIMMPELNGLELVKIIREFSEVPIIFLTALSDEKSQTLAYDYGADGYLIKPFSSQILISIVKRFLNKKEIIKKYENLELHFKSRKILLDNKELYLPTKERELLFYLVENEGVVKNREQILNAVWGYDFYGNDRVVDKHMTKLRDNLQNYSKFLKTIKMVGYKFEGSSF